MTNVQDLYPGQKVMSEHLKYFKTLQEVNGYIINDIPWVGYVEETEQVLYCKEEDCKIVVNNDLAEVVELCILRYNATAKLTQADNLGTVSVHEWDSSTGDGRVIYDESVTSIGNYAFQNCANLRSVTIPNSVTSIGEMAFYYCTNLISVTIPNSVTSIGYGAFYNCSGLTSVTIPNSVTNVGSNTFYRCSGLTSVTIGNSVTSIGDRAFQYCSKLTSVTIGDSVTSIGNNAFEQCSVTSIEIPNSVTSIGDQAFLNCKSLISVTIGDSVTSIGSSAFTSNTSLAYIYCLPIIPPTLKQNTWNNVSTSIPVYVPAGSVSAYQSAQYWSNFTNIQAIS